MAYKMLSGFHFHEIPFSSREVGIWKDCQTQGKIKCKKKNPGSICFCRVCAYCLKVSPAPTWCNDKTNSDGNMVIWALRFLFPYYSTVRRSVLLNLLYRDVHKLQMTMANTKVIVSQILFQKPWMAWRYILHSLQSCFQYRSLFS